MPDYTATAPAADLACALARTTTARLRQRRRRAKMISSSNLYSIGDWQAMASPSLAHWSRGGAVEPQADAFGRDDGYTHVILPCSFISPRKGFQASRTYRLKILFRAAGLCGIA